MEFKPNEIIPGASNTFTETGIDGDASNVLTLNHVRSLLGKFNELEPAMHYEEYFREQDKKFEDAEKPGLLKAVMARSNSETVSQFDQLVDEFNGRLPQIKETRGEKLVKEYVDRIEKLKHPGKDITEKS